MRGFPQSSPKNLDFITDTKMGFFKQIPNTANKVATICRSLRNEMIISLNFEEAVVAFKSLVVTVAYNMKTNRNEGKALRWRALMETRNDFNVPATLRTLLFGSR